MAKKKLPCPSKSREENPPFSPENSDWLPEAKTHAWVSAVPPEQLVDGVVVNPAYWPVEALYGILIMLGP